MSDKHFAAILAKNDLAEKIGELVATNQIGVSDKTYILACLNDIEKIHWRRQSTEYRRQFQ